MITAITAEQVRGAVQARFPRFTFDDKSRPSLTDLGEYIDSAVTYVSRMISLKGYNADDVLSSTNPNVVDDTLFIRDWIVLKVAVEVHAAQDQFKDGKTSNIRADELKALLTSWNEITDPFPAVERTGPAEPQGFYPTRLVRS